MLVIQQTTCARHYVVHYDGIQCVDPKAFEQLEDHKDEGGSEYAKREIDQ